MAKDKPFIIDDGTDNDLLFPTQFGRGYEERDYSKYPQEYLASPDDMKLHPKSEWSDRIKEQVATKSRLSDLRTFKNLNQAQSNYCWGHSTVHAHMVTRKRDMQPDLELSAYAVCSTIMKGANKGGWCGLSAKFLTETGVPTTKYWAQGKFQGSMTGTTLANAKKHRTTEDWVDLTKSVYDQNLTFAQIATCLLNRIPVAVDFNWWRHSVCALDLVETEPGAFGLLILNSWAGWGDNGTGILVGQKAIAQGAVAFRVVTASDT